jgi:hypothetical protein
VLVRGQWEEACLAPDGGRSLPSHQHTGTHCHAPRPPLDEAEACRHATVVGTAIFDPHGKYPITRSASSVVAISNNSAKIQLSIR